jgi:hypothetical protein
VQLRTKTFFFLIITTLNLFNDFYLRTDFCLGTCYFYVLLLKSKQNILLKNLDFKSYGTMTSVAILTKNLFEITLRNLKSTFSI